MTVGTISDVGTLANGASADIRPGSANGEWIIHNIFITNGATCEIMFGDGSDWVDIFTKDESMTSIYFHSTYTHYYRVVNNSGGSIYYGYDGVSIA